MCKSSRTMKLSKAAMLLACAGVIATGSVRRAGAQPVPRPATPESAPTPTPNQLRHQTMQKMMRPITIEFTGNRLEEVLDFFEQVADIQIEAKWLSERHAIGLDKDFEINLKVENMTVVNALERVLDRTLEDETDAPTWQLTNWGEVEVGPRSRLNARKYVKIYPVQDLLFQIPDFTNVPNLNIDDVLDQGGQGGGGSIFDDPDNDPNGLGPSEREEVERLVRIIQTFVEEDQWDANGGTGGTIRYFRGSLVIRGADYMHRALLGYDFPVPEEYRPYKRPKPATPKPMPSPSNPVPPSQ
ncbi:MAG: hypothetical protein ACIAQF_05290 [Phycisphaerales bacterium JB065]